MICELWGVQREGGPPKWTQNETSASKWCEGRVPWLGGLFTFQIVGKVREILFGANLGTIERHFVGAYLWARAAVGDGPGFRSVAKPSLGFHRILADFFWRYAK